MNVYIAKDFNGEPLGVLLATDKSKAELVWLGTGCTPHSVEEIDLSDDNLGMHGVVTLLSSIEVTKRDIDHKSFGWTFRSWKRGL